MEQSREQKIAPPRIQTYPVGSTDTISSFGREHRQTVTCGRIWHRIGQSIKSRG